MSQIWCFWKNLNQKSLRSLTIVDGEKLVSDPLSEIVRVEHFLGLRNYITKQNFVFDEKKGFHCMIFNDGHKQCLTLLGVNCFGFMKSRKWIFFLQKIDIFANSFVIMFNIECSISTNWCLLPTLSSGPGSGTVSLQSSKGTP